MHEMAGLLVWIPLLCLALIPPVCGNRIPYFLPDGDMSNFALPEDTPVASVVYTLQGRDPEDSRLTYSISGDSFSVDKETGAVTLVRPLDREKESVLEVIVSITDEKMGGPEPNTVSLRREVKVLDKNDNGPVFLGRPYAVTVPETTLVGATIFTGINVSDADDGANAAIRISCDHLRSPLACDMFSVDGEEISRGNYVGIVGLKQVLDFRDKSSYTLSIKAEDQASYPHERRTSFASLVVQVQDLQNQPPVFLNAPFTATLPEGAPPDTLVLTVRAQDGDTGQPRPLRLSLFGDDGDYFRLGEAIVNSSQLVSVPLLTSGHPIDREDPRILHNGGLYVFQVKAVEMINGELMGEESFANVTIVVSDMDDQKPRFNQRSFNVTVTEDIGKDTPLPGLALFATDDDAGPNSHFSLSLRNDDETDVVHVDSSSIFAVSPVEATGRTPVNIRLINPSVLDFEDPTRRQFRFQIVAWANGQEADVARVTVTLSDANDNSPVFATSTYRFKVDENVAPGTVIAVISATDADSGDFGQITYELKGFGSERFSVDEQLGKVSVGDCGSLSCLDYELQSAYSLTYTARDGGGKASSVSLHIEVNDVNDNPPVFKENEYRRLLREGAESFQPQLIVKASDADGPGQGAGHITYSLVKTANVTLPFGIDSATGEISPTRALFNHDAAPSGRFDLTVRAVDAGHPPLHTDVAVYINVGVEGNQPPMFKSFFYNSTVQEDAPPGTEVTRVSATDQDGPDSSLVYSIVEGAKDNFIIGRHSGIVSVASEASLDPELHGPSYTLMVRVMDRGSPHPQTGSATLQVTISDVNNKPPRFLKESFVRHVSERMAVGEELMIVEANDPDSNADLVYDIVEPYWARDKAGVKLAEGGSYDYKSAFRIEEKSGHVTVSQPLDHNSASVIGFTVRVRDMAADKSVPVQEDRAEVTVYVAASDDASPTFPAPWTPSRPQMRVSVHEEQTVGTILVTLAATDPRTGQSVHRFEEVEGSDLEDWVVVERYSGAVLLNRRLDYESMPVKSFTFQVRAVAEGELSSVATVTIDVEDVNDHTPSFDQEDYHVRVPETAGHSDILLTVHASDPDILHGFGDVRYSLSGEGASLLDVDRVSGVVKVASGSVLNREKQAVVKAKLVATDTPQGGAQQKKGFADLVVEILDVNDNSPTFSQSAYTAVVTENAVLGTVVTKVSATDPDESYNGQVEYSLIGGAELSGYLSVHNATGEVLVQKVLTGKGRSQPYMLTLRAQDLGDIPLSAEVPLRVFVGDVSPNDGVPTFLKPGTDDVAYVPENSPIGTSVFQVIATDPDDPRTSNGKVTYKFLEEGSVPFHIDFSTGLITTSSVLDREMRSNYTLILVAHDMGTPRQQASRILVVVVGDVDDNVPVFTQQERQARYLEMSLIEEVPMGTLVGKVVAVDLDEGENAKIDYAIVAGNENGAFQIRRTDNNEGDIIVMTRIDREQVEEFKLMVACFPLDKDRRNFRQPFETDAQLEVRIRIKDIDDNNPEFSSKESTVGVRLTSPVNTELARVSAKDPDPEAAPLVYELINNTFVRPDGPRQEMASPQSAIAVNPETGSVVTAASLAPFVDGHFRLLLRASDGNNGPSATTLVKVFVLRDHDLLKFVFGKPPGEVRKALPEFRAAVEKALVLPVTLNVYDAQFYSKEDGSLDFSSTSSCFQVVSGDRPFHVQQMESLVMDEQNLDLAKVYDDFGVLSIERCVPSVTQYSMSWIEWWVIGIAGFIAIAGWIASCVVCALHGRYKKHVYRNVPAGPVTLVAPSIVSSSEGPRMYEWQDQPSEMTLR